MAQTTPSSQTLADLRRRLDSIDDRLLDLLAERARVMDDVRAAKAAEGGSDPRLARPGREMTILRRLIDRIKGPLPPDLVVRLWRDIMTSFTRLQGAFAIAVLRSESYTALMALARQHYGQSTPLLTATSPAQVFARLDDGRAQLALLPSPEDAPDLDWWRNLDPAGLQVVARLPVDGVETQPGALVVGRAPFEESGADRGLLVVVAETETSRAKLGRAFGQAGIGLAGTIAESERGGRQSFLAVTETYVAPGDARLAALSALGLPAKVAGGYAVPLGLAAEKAVRRGPSSSKGVSR
ncbi:MAG: chorismate mutase [Rhodospirillales bacterium]|nr:chorismate mutase [Rhodospirillales bacterium]